MNVPLILAAIAAVGAPIGAYLVASRQFSGKIETSDAAELWAESRAIREWSAKRMRELNELVGNLEIRVRDLELHNGTLEAENKKLTKELAECRKQTNP
jgi:predicted RNase H-like nuclease (RuvC/YqgF family)